MTLALKKIDKYAAALVILILLGLVGLNIYVHLKKSYHEDNIVLQDIDRLLNNEYFGLPQNYSSDATQRVDKVKIKSRVQNADSSITYNFKYRIWHKKGKNLHGTGTITFKGLSPSGLSYSRE
ncbi:MAG: hypothetical protein IK042_02830 [Bacteroidales bacterium]|nr:hypothetical protein [Bacteroidales bacterium]